MRDPRRIKRMLAVLERVWLRESDLRLGQLLVNISPAGRDPFHVEDDEWAAALDRELERLRQEPSS